MDAGPEQISAQTSERSSTPSPVLSQARPTTPLRPKEARVRRAGCPGESHLDARQRDAGAVGGPGCGPRRHRRCGTPRTRPAAGFSSPWRRPRGAQRAGQTVFRPYRRIDLGQRAASRQSRCGAATGRRPGARRSGREPRATLGPATSQDRATGAGAHPQAEPVGLRPPTVVRLEGALTHSWAPVRRSGAEAKVVRLFRQAVLPQAGCRAGSDRPLSDAHDANDVGSMDTRQRPS